MAEIVLGKLAEVLGGELEGDAERIIRGVGPIESASADEVTFLANPKYEKYVPETRAAAVLVSADYSGPAPASGGLIRCRDPYFAFRQVMVTLYGFRKPYFEGVSPLACIDADCEVAPDVRIGANATVAARCRIGPQTVIYPGVHVGPDCVIGRDCTIYPNVTLYDGTKLGDRVTIHAGTSIGHDGFGYATHKGDDGVVRHEKIPQGGWVELEDDVEIGACCAIDRATLGATVIGAGTKFSNLVAIGHGTRMGRHCLLVAQAGIAGSVVVEDYAVFAGQAGVVGHIRIGAGARIGAKTGVTNDVPPGQEVFGVPSMPLAQAKRAFVTLPRLPQIRTAVRRLAREVNAIKRRLGMPAEKPERNEEQP